MEYASSLVPDSSRMTQENGFDSGSFDLYRPHLLSDLAINTPDLAGNLQTRSKLVLTGDI